MGIRRKQAAMATATATAYREQLPAGFGNPGDHSCQSKLSKTQPREFEPAEISAAAAGKQAAINDPDRAGILWEEGKTDIIALSLQLCADGGVFFNGFLFALVALDPGSLCHSEPVTL
jgi:hypothetical protein